MLKMINKRKVLYLITNFYPYGNDTGEMYLRYELSYLCHNFDEVNIIACNASSSNELLLKNIPSNLNIVTLSDSNNKVKYLLKTIKVFLRKKEKYIEKEWKLTNTFKKKIFLSYFIAKAENRFKKLCEKIQFEKNNDSDELYLYSYRFFDLAYIAVKLKNKLVNNEVKIFSRAHGYDLYEYANPLNYLPLRNYLLDNVDYIYCCSINGMNYLKKEFPQFSKKISSSYLGSKDFGFDFNSSEKTFEIVSCSNLKPVKQIDFIAEVIAKLSSKINVCWTHIGGSTEEILEYKDKYKDLINKNVMIFKGEMNHNEVINFYKNKHFDLFINLSKSEGISQSIMEAISYGIPVVATNVGGTPEIVKNNISGFLVEKEDNEETICNKIISYHEMNDKEKVELRKKTRKYWEDNFNVESNANRFIQEIIKEEIK